MKLYKYTPYINAFLESSALPLTPMWQLNDPFEAKLTDHFIDSFENSMRESRLDFSELLIAESVKNLKENGRYKGIVSFSKRRFDTLMMTHYGDEHRGGVLEFEVDDVAEGYDNETGLFDRINPKTQYNFGSVIYQPSRRLDLQDDFHKYISSGIFFEKSLAWEKEEEIRYLSDFRCSDYVLIPKKELVFNYVEEQKKQYSKYSPEQTIHSYQRAKDYFQIEYEGYSYDRGEECIFQGKPKKIRSIIGRIFGADISSYEETESHCKLVLKQGSDSYFGISRAMAWTRFIADGYKFHPMIKVDSSALTGIYLGSRFAQKTFKEELLSRFSQLNGNVQLAKVGADKFGFSLQQLK